MHPNIDRHFEKAVATKDEKIVGQLGKQLKEISAEASESLTNLRKGEILANAQKEVDKGAKSKALVRVNNHSTVEPYDGLSASRQREDEIAEMIENAVEHKKLSPGREIVKEYNFDKARKTVEENYLNSVNTFSESSRRLSVADRLESSKILENRRAVEQINNVVKRDYPNVKEFHTINKSGIEKFDTLESMYNKYRDLQTQAKLPGVDPEIAKQYQNEAANIKNAINTKFSYEDLKKYLS